jgi:hypothetical protein
MSYRADTKNNPPFDSDAYAAKEMDEGRYPAFQHDCNPRSVGAGAKRNALLLARFWNEKKPLTSQSFQVGLKRLYRKSKKLFLTTHPILFSRINTIKD